MTRFRLCGCSMWVFAPLSGQRQNSKGCMWRHCAFFWRIPGETNSLKQKQQYLDVQSGGAKLEHVTTGAVRSVVVSREALDIKNFEELFRDEEQVRTAAVPHHDWRGSITGNIQQTFSFELNLIGALEAQLGSRY